MPRDENTKRLFQNRVPLGMLGVVVFVELCWCIDYHMHRWDEIEARLTEAPAEKGDGLVIQRNGLGYYAWLRSLIVDGDWSFENEFDEHNPLHHYVPPPGYVTPIGRRANQWSVGPACLWAVAVVPVHVCLHWLGANNCIYAANGYSLPYQLTAGTAAFLATAVGLGLLYKICREYASPLHASLGAARMTLGTMIFYYNAIEITMAHGPATAVLAAFVWCWLKSYGSLCWRRWFAVGLLLGVTALMRWQLATFAVVLVGEAGGSWFAARKSKNEVIARNAMIALAVGALGVVAGFAPQMIAWRCVYGSWLIAPIPGVRYHWLSPSLWAILFSHDRSLFYWTPLAFVAFLASLVAAGCNVQSSTAHMLVKPLRLLLAAFLVQVYVLGSMWGKGDSLPHTQNAAGVFLGRSFGFRDLAESLVALAPGLSLLCEHASRRWFRLLRASMFIVILCNLLLVGAFAKGELPHMEGASLWVLLEMVRRTIVADPFILVLALMGPVALELLLACFYGQLAKADQQPVWQQSPRVAGHSQAFGKLYCLSRSRTVGAVGVTLAAAIGGSFWISSTDPQFYRRAYRDQNGKTYPYQVFIPRDYGTYRKWPVILFLHGSGDSGDDGDKQTKAGLGPAIRAHVESFPFIVVFPQSVERNWEMNGDGKRALAILDRVCNEYQVDLDRVYLTGFLMGGRGTWQLAALFPDRWAAIVPICGSADSTWADRLKRMPCWSFHGARDNVIPVDQSRIMIQSLRLAGGKPRYTEYPNLGHNVAKRVYANNELYDWLLEQRRGNAHGCRK